MILRSEVGMEERARMDAERIARTRSLAEKAVVKVYENPATKVLYVRLAEEGQPEGTRVLLVVAPDGLSVTPCEACNGEGMGFDSEGEPMECPQCGGMGAV